MQCLVPVAPDSSSYRVWFFILIDMAGPDRGSYNLLRMTFRIAYFIKKFRSKVCSVFPLDCIERYRESLEILNIGKRSEYRTIQMIFKIHDPDLTIIKR